MTQDLNSLARSLYDTIDRLLREHPDLTAWRPDPGFQPRLSDAELATLALMQALLGYTSEARWLRHAHAHLHEQFPYLPQQSGYNKRLRKAADMIGRLTRLLATDTTAWTDDVWVVDSTPVECARSRETVKRSKLAGWATYGYCPSHSRFFWGFRLYLVTTTEGMPVTWCLAHPKIGDHDLVRTGQVILADKGFAGREFERFVTDRLGVTWCDPTARTNPRATAAWPGSASGSKRSSTRSRDSSAWRTTAGAPRRGSMPAPASGCWPWRRRSGTTGRPTHRSKGRLPPTSTEDIGLIHLGWRVVSGLPRGNVVLVAHARGCPP